MLNNDTIATGLHRLAATTTGTGEGPPLLFACWETQAARAVCKPLLTATAALHAALAERGPAEGMPAMPPVSALAGSTVEWVDGSADPLLGIGLLTAGTEDAEPATAWIAMPEGMTLIWQSIPAPGQGHPEIPGDAYLRVETGTPLWHDAEAIFATLERFRAAVTGWPPHLPEHLRGGAEHYRPSTTAWTGPC